MHSSDGKGVQPFILMNNKCLNVRYKMNYNNEFENWNAFENCRIDAGNTFIDDKEKVNKHRS